MITGSDANRPLDHLAAGFLRSAELFPDRPALQIGPERLTYLELRQRCAAIAAALREHTPGGGPPFTAVFAHRSVTAFSGVLGVLVRGHGYVPLNRTYPVLRTRSMFERSGCRALIVDEESAAQLEELVVGAREPLLIVAPDLDDTRALAARLSPHHTVLGKHDLAKTHVQLPELERPAEDMVAYLLFTSGSTGQPKGVMVAHRNVAPFIRAMAHRYGINERDRCSQTHDLTFDVSVFDLFVAWEGGACLHCPTDKTLLRPAGYIRDHELTVWVSVPSVANFLMRLGGLKPESYPSLRLSLFIGEALPVSLAEAWAAAAPNSVVENMYGPTEVTIACTWYPWDGARSPAEAHLGIVPIGRPTPPMEALVVDENLVEVAAGQEGELLMAGPQVTLGYLDDPERTAAAFVVPPGKSAVHYRTGDRVLRSQTGDLLFVGRIDHQVQVHGHRVELGEIEAAIREATAREGVVALGWPPTESGSGGVIAFVESGAPLDLAALHSALTARLPDYMVPRTVRVLPEFPLNVNGKYDRHALRSLLEEEAR
jgi:amino acid adenylation domain-containing protein